jgi:hypothetical protein
MDSARRNRFLSELSADLRAAEHENALIVVFDRGLRVYERAQWR